MANKEDVPPRGNEWEVVSLTSSAYAAAPSPYNDPRKYDSYYGAETSRDLFMSDHFVFPPSEHENLPLEEEEQQRKDYEESMMLEGQGLSDGNLRFHDESAMYEQKQHGLIDDTEAEEEDLVLYSDNNTVKLEKDAKSLPPCEAWWRRRAFSRTREANAIWSLFFAATVTGLVVLGQRWQQQERWQVMQLKWQSSISSEKLSRVILQPLSRLKDVIVRGSNSQASLIRSGSTSEI